MAKHSRITTPVTSILAKHEAAHAVVAIALGLPLESVSIGGATITGDNGRRFQLAGCTRLSVSASEHWRRDWRDPVARVTLANEAIMSAAGICCDLTAGARLGDRSHRLDAFKIMRIAGMLGIGASIAEQPVRRFLAECIEAAGEILKQSDCEQWNRLSNALHRQRSLSGDQARTCIAAVGPGEVRRALPSGVPTLVHACASEYSRLALTLGGNVTAADVDYGITVTVRLLKIERDLLNNMNTKLTLANRPVLLTTLLQASTNATSAPSKALVTSAGAASVLTPPATDTPITTYTAPATIPAGANPTVTAGGSSLAISPGAGVTTLPAAPGGASTAVAVASPGAPPPSRPNPTGTSGGGRVGLK